MQDQAIRIDLRDDQFTGAYWQNLFWVKSGYGFFVEGELIGDAAARALKIMQEILPMQAVAIPNIADLESAEEVFYFEPVFDLIEFPKKDYWPTISVRQIGKRQFGRVRIMAKLLRKEFQKS